MHSVSGLTESSACETRNSTTGIQVKCPKCHADNSKAIRFCEECGTRLELVCSNCGQHLTPGKKFCGSCGAPAVPAESAASTSPATYTPAHLAEKILTSRSALEGERKQVTVLFADLKGSMELLADRDPEEARKLLDPVLEPAFGVRVSIRGLRGTFEHSGSE